MPLSNSNSTKPTVSKLIIGEANKKRSPAMTTTGKTRSTARRRVAGVATAPKSPVAIEDIEDFSPSETLAIRSSLLRWYDGSHRDLPWRMPITATGGDRNSEDPAAEDQRAYAVWVSEVMLQQTRVHTVIGYFNRWMEKWPTVCDLSTASLEEVNEMWAGLGYYRRARFLLEGAKVIAENGVFPRSSSALRSVQGIGDYTAGAIASIAFSEVVPVVDGNVVRVITRLKAISANPKESRTVKLIWKLAGELVDPSRPGDFNQAIMELGATLCSSTNPNCFKCPVSDQCLAFMLSRQRDNVKVTDYPTKVAKAKQRNDFAAVCIVEIADGLDEEILSDEHHFLLIKRPENGLLAGLWEFPSLILDEASMNQSMRRKEMNKYLRRLFNVDIGGNCKVVLRQDVGEYVHIFSHIRLKMSVELLVLSLHGGFSVSSEEDQSKLTWKCVNGDSLRKMGLTSGVRKVYNMALRFKKQLTHIPKQIPKKKAKRTTG
ncbi:A/G-specific adenine DNA glycosylase [Apostasia shenzhenica]|uniref:Adenine DNA glycosylase n=1 Tax=Apostasia shenzhenica TaxID=1088818 RepID=A0A2I0AKZ0_9ASPA|nr:A/G-specific adenine DNA glycosylase [Apostasia shenzhenica]